MTIVTAGSALPHAILERIGSLRAHLHPFKRIEAKKTALVVIDLQNMFVAEGGVYEIPAARAIVDNVNRLAAALRAHNGVVAWIRMKYDPADPWPNFYQHMLSSEKSLAVQEALTPGNEGFALYPALDVTDGDMIVDKTRFSAFLPASSDLAERLRRRGIDTVLIAGTVTNTCCECSARDAMMMDFKTIMIADANAGSLEETHVATLANFLQVLGDVQTTDEVLTALAAKR